MKPAWDKLMAEYKDSASVLVADLDCTAAGKSKCDEVGVRGFPTIKHGDPNDLQDYEGGRDFDALKAFTDGLGPTCSPDNLDLCDDAKKKQIEEFKSLGANKREFSINEKEEKMEKTDRRFKTFVDSLQKTYQESLDKKNKDIEALKNSGLGLLKAVHAHEKQAKSEL